LISSKIAAVTSSNLPTNYPEGVKKTLEFPVALLFHQRVLFKISMRTFE